MINSHVLCQLSYVGMTRKMLGDGASQNPCEALRTPRHPERTSQEKVSPSLPLELAAERPLRRQRGVSGAMPGVPRCVSPSQRPGGGGPKVLSGFQRSEPLDDSSDLVDRERIEPSTLGLRGPCTTVVLPIHSVGSGGLEPPHLRIKSPLPYHWATTPKLGVASV